MNVISEHDKNILLNLICNEQTHMLMKKDKYYESSAYRDLEELKVKVKNL